MKRRLSLLISFVILALVAVFMWRNWEQMLLAFSQAKQASLGTAVGAFLLVGVGVFCASMAYRNLALRKLPFVELFIVENSAVLMSRALPAGVGGMGVHGVYLHKRGHSIPKATAVVATNNMLGFLVHIALLVICLLAVPSAFRSFRLGSVFSQGWIYLGLLGALAILALTPAVRKRLANVLGDVRTVLASYRSQPQKLFWACLFLAGVTLSNVLVLWLAGREVAPSAFAHISLVTVFIIFSMGVLVGASVPTPGGLAGVEAGLVAGLTSYGLEFSTALAIALLFRLATYWLPMVPGAICLALARYNKLI